MNEQDAYATKEELKTVKDNFEAHNLSKKICEAINTQKDIDKAIKGIVTESLKNDVETQETIKKIIYKNWKIFIVYAIPIILGVIQTYFLYIK